MPVSPAVIVFAIGSYILTCNCPVRESLRGIVTCGVCCVLVGAGFDEAFVISLRGEPSETFVASRKMGTIYHTAGIAEHDHESPVALSVLVPISMVVLEAASPHQSVLGHTT